AIIMNLKLSTYNGFWIGIVYLLVNAVLMLFILCLTISVAFFSLGTIFCCVLYLIGLMLLVNAKIPTSRVRKRLRKIDWLGNALFIRSATLLLNVILFKLERDRLVLIGIYRGIYTVAAILSASNNTELQSKILDIYVYSL
ncbi:hypothetical protein CCHL11_02771, partial [Colletotrichum chlorophyti]